MNIIVANWKMNPQTAEEARVLAHTIEHGVLAVQRSAVETVICPPFVFLPVLRHALHLVKLGAQNVSAEETGAFTGEVSARQLQDFSVRYVIIGHSERRLLGEDDKFVNRKMKMALASGIEPILCVGYGTKKTHNDTAIQNIVRRQIKKGVTGIKASKIVIAYEPVWAISQGLGTGRPATPEHAAGIIQYIKKLVPHARVIYGGSLDGKNAKSYAKAGLEGGLVGGASLKPDEFIKIIKSFQEENI